jgi:uncharacterized membrane protein YkoI
MRWTFTFLIAGFLLFTSGLADAFAQPGPAAPHARMAPAGQVRADMQMRMTTRQQNQAREAYKRGEIKSLAVIRRNVITTYNGRIISTQYVERRKAPVPYLYTFRVLGKDGQVMVVHVDARNANIIRVKGAK